MKGFRMSVLIESQEYAILLEPVITPYIFILPLKNKKEFDIIHSLLPELLLIP
jgi:hypothetical protein